MSGQDHRAADSHFRKWMESISPLEENPEIVRLSIARSRAADEAGAAIARQLNGPLTALLLYMNEIKQHSNQFSQASGNRVYLQQVVENALQQTERVCALVKQMSDNHPAPASDAVCKQAGEGHACRPGEGARKPGLAFAPGTGQKPLTKREREVLSLISDGCSNKQGALRMNISPRTFESHRAEAMRKLGARNTADLVRKALLQPA
ncbi:transcriptional regulator [Bradyrhizobium valentinum]|uniref:Transcriptional regulator n=2 Tax=Bradyrhizobium valentinum TaxID=1518501 RepID=A0A0R3KHW8_9BRAD|nr:helix-turn-helix transcriptional regulator [Bradyrhizobium valentinum]KRQ95320.1 transcriptional regulator [Bradyrhizobium valentinum]KRQ98048.1 transcriptional regulator [Bradyrhizobium valentinum]